MQRKEKTVDDAFGLSKFLYVFELVALATMKMVDGRTNESTNKRTFSSFEMMKMTKTKNKIVVSFNGHSHSVIVLLLPFK